MKRTLVLIVAIALLSLACVQSAIVASEGAIETPARFILSTEQEPTSSPHLCAVVTAVEALHLRDVPAADGLVLTWLKHGDAVRVVDQINGDWWRVRIGDLEGYARAAYLEVASCEDAGGHDGDE